MKNEIITSLHSISQTPIFEILQGLYENIWVP